MITFQKSEITTSKLGLRSTFDVVRDIPIRGNGDINLAKSIYDRGQGINEILTSSFKLHDPRKDFVVDPWEAIIVELSLLFSASMVVAKVRSEEQDGSYFIRTNVTDSELQYIRGEPSQRALTTETAPILPRETREWLDRFFGLHTSSEQKVINGLPLGGLCKPDEEQLKDIRQRIRTEYDSLLHDLKEATSLDEKKATYYKAKLHNSDLLRIGQIAVLALYHVHPNTKAKNFIGSLEIYLSEEIHGVDADLIANLALVLSESVNQLRPIDFRSYRNGPTVTIAHIPSFREYGKDLDRYVEAITKGDGAEHMTTESSLPEVFDDLYMQIRQLLELYVEQPQDISVAFVVPERPNGKGESIGRYYFPPRFVKTALNPALALTETRAALDVLKASNTSRRVGVPLDLGLFGYMGETGFPVILRHKLEEDARTQSYDDELQKHELMLFLRNQDTSKLSVIEFPLVLFSDDERKHIYPSGLIIFLSGVHQDLPFPLHHLYALSCDARYALSKAFAAEVYREDQVNQLSNVVHDIDRMCRPFAKEISKISSYLESTPSVGEVLNVDTLKTSALVIQDILQFAQWTANRQSHDRPNEAQGLRVETLSDSLHQFQDVFSYIWCSDPSKAKWPGWEILKVLISDSHIAQDEAEPSFKWPQGALYTILWNLSANAEKKYRSLPDDVLAKITSSPAIECRVGDHRRVKTKAGTRRWVRDAIFHLCFPQIDFWDKSLQNTDVKEATTCRYPSRIFCVDDVTSENSCDHLGDCGPYRHATIFNSENAPTGKRGLKSCRQALDEWFSLMDLEAEESQMQTVKAGLPVLIKFSAPVLEG